MLPHDFHPVLRRWWEGRFGEPTWPAIKPAKIFRMAFRDRGRLIDSTEHPLVQKWAGRDRDEK